MADLAPDHIVVGILLRVLAERWDAPPGTVARVTGVGSVGAPPVWCFTLEWLNRPACYGGNRFYGLNLWEEDLQDFALHTDPILYPPDRKSQRRGAKIPLSSTHSSAYRMDTMTLFPSEPPSPPSVSLLVGLGTST